VSLDSWRRIEQHLDRYILDGKVNDYYEVVFADLVAAGALTFEAVSFDGRPWYEIDTLEDLQIAEKHFEPESHQDRTHRADAGNHRTENLSPLAARALNVTS
jgi:NDP-sugar pyrophosphorylase family protein